MEHKNVYHEKKLARIYRQSIDWSYIDECTYTSCTYLGRNQNPHD